MDTQVLFLLTSARLDGLDESFGDAFGTCVMKPCKEDFSTTEQVRQFVGGRAGVATVGGRAGAATASGLAAVGAEHRPGECRGCALPETTSVSCLRSVTVHQLWPQT